MVFSGSPSRLASGLPVAARDSERASEVIARGALLGRGVDSRSDVALDRTELAQVRGELAGPVAQLAGELAQLLGQPGPRILGVATPGLEIAGDLLEAVGLSIGGLADLLSLGDHRVLRVGQGDHRDEERHGRHRGDRRVPREARLEQRRHRAERLQRISSLAPDEPVGLGGFVHRRDRCVEVDVHPPGGVADRGEPDGQFDRRRHAVSEPALDVHRQRRLAERRTGAGCTPTSQTSSTTIGIAAATSGAASSGTNRAIVQIATSPTAIAASAIHPRRTIRRSQRRRRCGASEVRMASSVGSSGPSRACARIGRDTAPPCAGRAGRNAAGTRSVRLMPPARRCPPAAPGARPTPDLPAAGRRHRLDRQDDEDHRQDEPCTTLLVHNRSRSGPKAWRLHPDLG